MITPGESSSRFHAVDVPSLEGWIAIGRAVEAVPESDRASLAVLRFILAERLNIAAREMRGLANRDDFEIPVTASGTGLLLVRTGRTPGGGRRRSSATAWTSWSASTIRTSR